MSIGSEMYATLAKGPVTSSSDANSIPGGGHVLLIPITHYPTLRQIPDDARPNVMNEIQRYTDAIRKFYTEHGHDMVVFEVSRQSMHNIGHAHLQIVPIPHEKSDMLEKTIMDEAQNQGVQFMEKLPVSWEYFCIGILDTYGLNRKTLMPTISRLIYPVASHLYISLDLENASTFNLVDLLLQSYSDIPSERTGKHVLNLNKKNVMMQMLSKKLSSHMIHPCNLVHKSCQYTSCYFIVDIT